MLTILLLFLGVSFAAAPDSFDYALISQDPVWINQLQYHRTLLGNWQSDAIDSHFFVAPDGRTNPEAELRAEVEMFQKNPDKEWGYVGQPIVCAFPTRKKFIEEKFGITIKNISCPDFLEWVKPFEKSQLVLIFSDSFPNNPASMFGHTFLLFSRHEPFDSAAGIQDYAVNFSADTTAEDEASIFYSMRGLLGGYKARYRMSPFYVMANRYTNWDSRDIWYLPLNFSETEVRRVVEHIWEIFTNTSFDYYFFTKNCSYRLLTALDYGRPGLNLHDEFYTRFPLSYVAPISTYRTISQRTASNVSYYTPSIRKSLKHRISKLKASQLKKYKCIQSNIENIKQEEDIAVLDASIAVYNYQKQTASSDYLSSKVLENLDFALRRRAKIRQPSPEENSQRVLPLATPLVSHLNRAFWISSERFEEQKSVWNSNYLGLRAGYHDLLNLDDGYVKWSNLNFVELELAQSNKDWKVHRINLFNLISFFLMDSFDFKPSWRAELGFNQSYQTFAKGGVGFAQELKRFPSLLYFFVNPIISSNKNILKQQLLFGEMEWGIILDIHRRGKLWLQHIEAFQTSEWKRINAFGSRVAQASFYVDKNNELRVIWKLQDSVESQSIGYFHSF